MNIFYLHENPAIAAELMSNKHIVKMILESAQMLSTAHQMLDGPSDNFYKAAYVNHPSTVWVRESTQHYNWLYMHFLALNREYTKRYNRTHATYTKLNEQLASYPYNMYDNGFRQPPKCMPDEFKCDDSIESYRNYYWNTKLFTHEDENRFIELVHQVG